MPYHYVNESRRIQEQYAALTKPTPQLKACSRCGDWHDQATGLMCPQCCGQTSKQ